MERARLHLQEALRIDPQNAYAQHWLQFWTELNEKEMQESNTPSS
jgi:hypothetical protein